jgi:hypothetical protein
MTLKRGTEEPVTRLINTNTLTLRNATPAERLAAALAFLPNEIVVPFTPDYEAGITSSLLSTWNSNFNGEDHDNALQAGRLLKAFEHITATLVQKGADGKTFRLTLEHTNPATPDVGKDIVLAPIPQQVVNTAATRLNGVSLTIPFKFYANQAAVIEELNKEVEKWLDNGGFKGTANVDFVINYGTDSNNLATFEKFIVTISRDDAEVKMPADVSNYRLANGANAQEIIDVALAAIGSVVHIPFTTGYNSIYSQIVSYEHEQARAEAASAVAAITKALGQGNTFTRIDPATINWPSTHIVTYAPSDLYGPNQQYVINMTKTAINATSGPGAGNARINVLLCPEDIATTARNFINAELVLPEGASMRRVDVPFAACINRCRDY